MAVKLSLIFLNTSLTSYYQEVNSMLEAPLNSVTRYVSLVAERGGVDLTRKQLLMLTRLLSGMILLGSLKISGVAAFFLMQVSPAAIYAMLRRAKIPYKKMFWGSLKVIIELLKVRVITLAIDDTERERSKGCKFLPYVRKAICKATGGWIRAQNLVFIVLVTERATIPIWFCFHRPVNLTKDQKKIVKKNPKKVKKFDEKYRTKVDLVCLGLYIVSRMLKKLETELGITLVIKCVAGDNGFASAQIQQAVKRYFDCQYVSKANPLQNVISRGKERSLKKFFQRFSSVISTISIRGRDVVVEYKAARVFISSYGRKVFVVALRYRGNKSWQYLFGTDLTWTAESVIKAYGLRWLVEVFFEDWKQYDGWGVGALQRSVDGAARGVFLSLLIDLFLLYYQRTNPSLREHGRDELYSAGTVIRFLQAESIHQAIEAILDHDNPRQKLAEIHEKLLEVAERRVSLKHAHRWDFESLEPSPGLTRVWRRRNRDEEEKQRILMQA